MILRVQTDKGIETFPVRNNEDAVRVLCGLVRAGIKCMSWEVRQDG